jgi:hypothetical protein
MQAFFNQKLKEAQQRNPRKILTEKSVLLPEPAQASQEIPKLLEQFPVCQSEVRNYRKRQAFNKFAL